jgi:dephospho-CoA kinase
MKLFGLTGGIGMGKSTSSDLLKQAGVAVIDTDVIARQVVEPGQTALIEVVELFGRKILDEQGHLNRAELAREVFEDSQARSRLEAILHPRIREVWLREVEGWRLKGHPSGVVVIPLLFETNAGHLFEKTICVACTGASQAKRLQARGWSADQVEKRNRAQMPVETKMDMASYVVWTESNLEVHRDQLRRIFEREQVPFP